MRRSVRPFARSFETRDHGGAPTQEPPEFLLGLCPCIADVPEGLGVAHRGLARALTEAGSLTSHSCPLVQRVTSTHTKTLLSLLLAHPELARKPTP